MKIFYLQLLAEYHGHLGSNQMLKMEMLRINKASHYKNENV